MRTVSDPRIKEIVAEEFAKGKKLGLSTEEITRRVNKKIQEYKAARDSKKPVERNEQVVYYHEMVQPVYGPPTTKTSTSKK